MSAKRYAQTSVGPEQTNAFFGDVTASTSCSGRRTEPRVNQPVPTTANLEKPSLRRRKDGYSATVEANARVRQPTVCSKTQQLARKYESTTTRSTTERNIMSEVYGSGGRPRTNNQHALEEFRRRFETETSHGKSLLRLLTTSGAGIWRVERDVSSGAPKWWINITLPENLQQMFDVRLELQVLYVEYDRIEPRTLSVLQRRMRGDARLEAGIALVASNDKNLAQIAARRRGELSLVDINLAEIEVDTRDLRTRISTVLTAVDHFDVTNPIQEPSAFFGRTLELDQLTQALNRGQSVGVFGLRKAGKTSLLNSLQRIRGDAGRLVVKVDISEIASADQFRVQMLERTWAAVEEYVAKNCKEIALGIAWMPKMRCLNAKGEGRNDERKLSLYWTEDLRTLIEFADTRLELFVDEIDQAYPERSNLLGDEPAALFQTLVQLRGLVQDASNGHNGLVLLCAGVDPSIFERPLLEGRDNLIYKLVRLLWLAPMEKPEMADMVRSLGRRMGVRIRDHAVIDRLYDEFGGHPLLTRKACSMATRGREANELPFAITLERISRAISTRGIDSASVQARDVFASFDEWFPSEAQIVRFLWSPDPEERELAEAMLEENPDGLAHATSYGLMFTDMSPRIRAILPEMTV
jgi:hypothetical protein